MAFRSWLGALVHSYDDNVARTPARAGSKRRNRKRVAIAVSASAGSPSGSGKDALRGLLAAGIVYYSGLTKALPADVDSDQVLLDIAVVALWPVVLASKLPKRWFEDLSELSSPRVARVVSYARLSRTTGVQVGVVTFMRSLSQSAIAVGVRNLLEDMSDAKRGGAFLTAVAIANGSPQLPGQGKGVQVIKWVLGAAAAGVIGNRIDALAVDAWDKASSAGHVDHDPIGADGDGSGGNSDFFGNGAAGGSKNNHGHGLVGVLHDLFT
jgi:hypothetical protein